MYAFVKYIDDNVEYIVDVNKIKKFTTEFDEKKPYKVQFLDGKYYKAYVVCVAETEEEAKAKADAKRFRMPSKKFMDELTEDTESDDQENQRQVVATSSSKSSSKGLKTKIAKEQYENMVMPTTNTKNTLQSLHNLKANNESNVIDQMKQKEKRLLERIEELEELNKKLQNVVINKFEELTNNICMKNPENKTEFNIGERKDGQVHLGRGIWIPEQTYDAICSIHYKKESLFIKEMALAVFGRHVLSMSSITGFGSNRIKDATPKPKLDSTKLMAIHDITRHYLQERGESQQ